MTLFTLSNARVVMPDGVVEGNLTVEDGFIAGVGEAARGTTIDMGGDLILPGLVDLHGDAIEKEVEPRPGALFPLAVALASIDRRLAAAGVTTAFHGISFAEGELGVRDIDMAERLAGAIHGFAPDASIDHRVHVRYELTDAASEARVTALVAGGIAHLLSFMDHTPGQGQFKSAAAYTAFHARVYRADEAAIAERIVAKEAEAANLVDRMRRLAAVARAHGVAFAGHDDEGLERIAFLARIGATVSEFPLDLETARAAHESGLVTLFGAPNVLRGASLSGALSARDAITGQVAGALCSDYAPQAMLPAVGVMTTELGLTWSEALALVADNPARAAGLGDRGRIAPGLRADLVRAGGRGAALATRAVWVAGRPVYGFGAGSMAP
jgi:alpha-D-ribose 1-methylphosphonate 5-triphosphate diphosphatase